MSWERLKSASKRTIGTKQTYKAVTRGQAKLVYIARDAEKHVVKDLIEKCNQQGIEIIYVDSMRELGKTCGIEVGAAAAAVLE